MNNRYTITDAANILHVHAHTLRYWEEELQLTIPRNELGHRVYYQEQIDMFRNIKELKEEGYQLQAIRSQVGAEMGNYTGTTPQEQDIAAAKMDKMRKFQEIINEAVRQAMEENREELGRELSNRIIGEMNDIARETMTKQEEQYRKLDLAIRQQLKSDRKSHFWKWGQREVAAKLKEELRGNKKEAVTKQDNYISET